MITAIPHALSKNRGYQNPLWIEVMTVKGVQELVNYNYLQ